MGKSEVIVLLLLFVLTCAQYEGIISIGGSRSTLPEVIRHSDSRANTAAAKASTRYPASTSNLYPNAPVPIAYPPFQEDPSYPYQQPQLYPLIIPSNGTGSNEPVYLAMFPMNLIYGQRYQDQEGDPSKSSYTPTSDDNIKSVPNVAYANPSDLNEPSYVNDPYNITKLYNNDPSYSDTASYLNDPSYNKPPTDPSTPSYPNKPSSASTPRYAANPSYPSTTSYPNNPPYPVTLYPNAPSYPNKPSSQKDPVYSENPLISDTHLDQPLKGDSYHGVKPPAKMYPCAGNSDGKTYAVSGVCFAYFECVNKESLYRQCDDHYRFDQTSGQCVPDSSCLSVEATIRTRTVVELSFSSTNSGTNGLCCHIYEKAYLDVTNQVMIQHSRKDCVVFGLACPEQWKPHPTDIYKFILGGSEMSCPYGTFFDYKICSCQSKSNLPQDYRR